MDTNDNLKNIALLIDASISRLPPFLVEHGGLNSGFMIAQVTAAARMAGEMVPAFDLFLYTAGDIASITPDGHILFGGRGDDMMILGTINVFPAEIERALLHLLQVGCVAAGRKHQC